MKILLIATVSEFFKKRAGMFFVLIGILFGFLSGREHHAFAAFFLTDEFGMLYLLAVWLVYTALCLHFLLNLWKQSDYVFVYHIRLLDVPKRLLRYLAIAIGFMQPLLYYGIYMISVAVQDRLLGRIYPLFVFYALISVIIMCCAEWRIRHPRLVVSKSQSIFRWNLPRPASWIYWSLEWILRERGITLLLCKGGSAIVVVCTLIYYSTDTYDLRLPAIGLSLGYLLNIGLSFELYQWESSIWLWNRSLPISINRRYMRVVLLHSLLLVPETLIALRYQVLTMLELLQLYVLGVAILVLFHVQLYKKNGLLEDSMQTILIGFVILTLLILYKIPVLLIAALALALSYFYYRKWYVKAG